MRNTIEIDIENVLNFLDRDRSEAEIIRHCGITGKRWKDIRALLRATKEMATVGMGKNKKYCRLDVEHLL